MRARAALVGIGWLVDAGPVTPAAMVDDARLTELWHALQRSRSSGGTAEVLGDVFVPRDDPRLVVCDPAFVATAPPLRARLCGDSNWTVSILARDRRVVAAMATMSTSWRHGFPLPWPRTFVFERRRGEKVERWEVTCDGADVTERALDPRGRSTSTSKTTGSPADALARVQQRIATKQRGGFVEIVAPAPPERWELASFDDGADTFAVDHATAMITDATSAASLRERPDLRAALERLAQGPPGCALLGDVCDVAWFGSGRGDGRYRAHWGATGDAPPTCLIVPFVLD